MFYRLSESPLVGQGNSKVAVGSSIVWVDPDFVDTYGMTLLAGRNFNPAIKSDMESVLINEAAVQAYDLGDNEKALSERLIIGGDTTAIVGVLKNYNWNSLKMEHTPFLLKTDTIMGRNFWVKILSRFVS